MSHGRWPGFAHGVFALVLTACAGNGEGLDENGRPIQPPEPQTSDPPTAQADGPQATIESIQEEVFTPRCASCHAGSTAPVGLRLEDAPTSHASLVGVRSVEDPSLLRVEAGNADDSYLIHKLEGTQSVGNQMPSGQPPLSPDTIRVIRQWIDDGAAAPRSSKSWEEAPGVVAFWPLPNSVLAAGPVSLWVGFDREIDASAVHSHAIYLQDLGIGARESKPILLSPITIGIAQQLPPGRYRLTLRGDPDLCLSSPSGVCIDGDADGRPGGDWRVEFSVRAEP